MGEETISSERQEALGDVTMLLDLAISRSLGSSLLDDGTKELVRGCLEAAKQELGQLAEPYGAANGDVDKEEVTTVWSKLFGGGDGLPREKVDAVVHVIDRYLAEEAELRRLQSEKQTIHPRDLPPEKAPGADRGGVRDPCGHEDEVFATTTIGSTAVLRPLYLDSWLPFTYWIRTDSDGVRRRLHKGGVNPRGEGVRPMQTLATRKEALPTCARIRPAAPNIASRPAGRCRCSMRRARPNDSGKRRPTRTMVVASSISSTDLLYERCSRPSPPGAVRVRGG
jgi:hypothetical protein